MSQPFPGSSGSSSSGPHTPPDAAREELTRKRTISSLSDYELEDEVKKPRLAGHASFSNRMNESFSDASFSIMRSPTTNRTYSTRVQRSLRPRLLSAASSYTDIGTPRRSDADEALQNGLAMMRSASVSSMDLRSLRSSSPAVQPYPETSAMRNMRVGKVFIDFSVTATGEEAAKTWPVSWSVNNVLVFGRGNRIHYKSLGNNEDVAQLCKLRDTSGDLRFLECGGKDQANAVAAGTSTGYIQLWDISTKKNTGSWQVSGASVMKWNSHTLTVGLQKGTIKHYDSRTPKSKESIKRVTRHQAKITSLAWNAEGKLYASGDETGMVFCWDIRQPGVPVEEVGDMVQRRRKIQHTGAVTALAWCPWQTKILATGDSTPERTGTIRVWTIGGSSFAYQSTHTDKIELDAPVTSLHFSPHCKEILSTHGPGKTTPAPQTYTEDLQLIENEPIPSPYTNAVVVHSYPSLRHVITLPGATSNIAGSLLSPNGQKVVLAVPEENKLKIWDVWARPTLRRQASALSIDGRIR